MRLSHRVDNLNHYFSVTIGEKIAEKQAKGEEVINFAIGDPDIPTPEYIIDELCRASRDAVNHRYPESAGMYEFRAAVCTWYENRFGVKLDPQREVVSLIGAKEGIAHISQCFIDKDDVALIPDPGYPVYATGARLCGGRVHYLPLNEDNGYLPDLVSIPEEILLRSRLLWLNYPNNPTGATADLAFFNRVVEFARKYDLVICHDGPYTEVAFDGYQPVSFLQAQGAKEVGIEFHSLSKSYNMTGWRVGMAVGNAEVIEALKKLKSNIDSGIPRAIQHMAITALTGPSNPIMEHNIIYQRRRDKIINTLHNVNIRANNPRAGLYIWARCPEGYSSVEFANQLLDEAGVVVTPGSRYGPNGNGYFRMSVTLDDGSIEKGLARMTNWLVKNIKDK